MTEFSTCSSTTGPLPGFTVAQVAWRIGVIPAVYRELEAGTVKEAL